MKTARKSLRFLTYLLLSALLITSCSTQKAVTTNDNKYENDIVAFEKLDKTETYPADAILFTGSSSIRLWSTLKEDIAPYHYIQRGFGGSRTPDVVKYLKRIAYPHQFSAVVIFVANDITGSPNDLKPKETLNNFREMVRIIRAKEKKAPVFIVEITPTLSRWKYWSTIRETNSLLKSFCNHGKNLYFIETASQYLNAKAEPRDELFREDHLHQNREGYKIWGRIIKDKLDSVLKK